jgi:hypothetical protein
LFWLDPDLFFIEDPLLFELDLSFEFVLKGDLFLFGVFDSF